MAGIFTRPALDKIMNNADLTPEQRTEQVFALYGRALDDGYVSKSAAEEAKAAAVEAAKAGVKIPAPVDPKTTPEYLEIARENEKLRTIGGPDFAKVKAKYREQVFGMLDRGEKAKPIPEQLAAFQEQYEELFNPATETKEQPKNTPQYSQQPGRTSTNPQSEEDKLFEQMKQGWN